MNEKKLAEQFNQDVDALLHEIPKTSSTLPSIEFSEDLELARMLAATDFSHESQVQETVRRQLLSQMNMPKVGQGERAMLWDFSRKLRKTAVVTMIILVAFLTLAMVSPVTLTSAARGIYNIVQRIVAGPNTTVLQIDSERSAGTGTADDVLRDDTWSIKTDIGNHGGNVLPGVDATVHSLTDVAAAQELVSFGIRVPNYLPEGYDLRQIQVSPIGSVFLYYDGPGHDITLMETSVGLQPDDDGDPQTVTGVGIMTMTDGKVIEVDFNGRPAAWLEDEDDGGNSLQWELDGISYTLGGIGMSLDEVMQIAASIE